jgi:hypothetical protein
MTSVIQKYVTEGVLNYVDHETPRHYFLYDGVFDEQTADVHRLVEDLCDENMALAKTIKNWRPKTRSFAKHLKSISVNVSAFVMQSQRSLVSTSWLVVMVI